MTEHTVVYELIRGGKRREVTRRIFEARGARILGTEQDVTFTYLGSYAGWHMTGQAPVTKAFATMADAQEWMDEMFRQHDLWKHPRPRPACCVIVN